MTALRVIAGGKEAVASSAASPSGLLGELYQKHAAAVFGRCRYLLRDDEAAKDALQDVFAKAL